MRNVGSEGLVLSQSEAVQIKLWQQAQGESVLSLPYLSLTALWLFIRVA